MITSHSWTQKWTGGDTLIRLQIARYLESSGIPGLNHVRDGSVIYFENNHWYFRKWDYVPGPGYDDVIFQAKSLENAVNVVLDYYYGEPIILNKWILPVHLHPEWARKRLNIVLKEATQVTPREGRAIRKASMRFREKLGLDITLPQIFASLFNPIKHSENPKSTLYLRRDLTEAFIVER